MKSYTNEQRVKIIEPYYENERSNQIEYRILRDFFGQFNRSNVRTIEKIVQKLEQTGSVGDVRTENITAVCDSLAEDPSTSTHRHAQ